MWVLTVRGYFAAMEALERAGENLNGTSLRVETGTFLSLPKQKIFAAEKDKLVFLIYKSRAAVESIALHSRWTRT